jgi:uncharacterized Zn-binding protein involved in type VI secretion
MAKGAVRLSKDKAGGRFFFTSNKSVFVNGYAAVCSDGLTKPHSPISIHTATHKMEDEQWSHSVQIGSLWAIRQDDKTTCGHTAQGSASVFFN